MLIAELNTVMRTLMDVLNMHLIPNCEGREGSASYSDSECVRRVEGNNTLWMFLLLSFYYDAGFLDFSLLGDDSQ